MSGQMYLGGKLLKQNQTACVFNTYVCRKMQERKENGKYMSWFIWQWYILLGLPMGRNALAHVTK